MLGLLENKIDRPLHGKRDRDREMKDKQKYSTKY